MNNYELKHIKGIPYYLNGETVYTFELSGGKPAETIVSIGTYDATTNNITYYPDWRDRVKSNIDAFRQSISIQDRDKLRETISKPIKQRRSTRNPRKVSTRTKSAKSE